MSTSPGAPGNAPTASNPMWQQPWFWQILDYGVQAASIYTGSQAAKDANAKNIALAREQRAWEKEMSDTAVQRRADDIQKAGGNRALAFTNSAAASTPTATSTSVEPTFRPDWVRGGGATQALLMQAQLRNLNAQTSDTEASARIKNVEASLREQLLPQEKDFRLNRFVESHEWDDLKTKILRSQDTQSAAEAKKLRETVEALIQTTRQQAEAGKLDLDALRNIASVGGIEAGRLQWIIKLILDTIRVSKD